MLKQMISINLLRGGSSSAELFNWLHKIAYYIIYDKTNIILTITRHCFLALPLFLQVYSNCRQSIPNSLLFLGTIDSRDDLGHQHPGCLHKQSHFRLNIRLGYYGLHQYNHSLKSGREQQLQWRKFVQPDLDCCCLRTILFASNFPQPQQWVN